MTTRNTTPAPLNHPASPDPSFAPAINLLTSDLLVIDELLSLPSAADLGKMSPKERDHYATLATLIDSLLARQGMAHGDKISIDADAFRELSILMAGLPAKKEAGGSTAGILTTMKHLMGDKIHADFLGIAGRDNTSDQMLTEDLRKNGIRLDPGADPDARAATSFIFTHPDGKRTIITYPGNAAQKLSSAQVSDERVAASHTVFVPISLWSKFDEQLPETLLKKSIAQDKTIILSIPKQASFGHKDSPDLHRRLIPHADVIVADEEELARWYKTGNDAEQAIRLLQADMASRDTVRATAGKPPRRTMATAFIRHKDNSATVLVSQSPPGIVPLIPAARYEIAAPPHVSQSNNIGVDDTMYAGFITALQCGMTPQKAGEYAMEVGKTKFLYDSVRIPGPGEADKATQKEWNTLHTSLSDSLANLESAIGFARTGVGNPSDSRLQRTPGQKTFDLFLYPLIANIGVFALSAWVTYHSNFNQNKANAFVKRSAWFKDQLAKLPGIGGSPQMVRNLNMVVWSFVDGSLMAPVVAAFESKRQPISRWFDKQMGTEPEDKSVYDQELHRSWTDVLKARAATFAFVIATYFTLNAKIFPHSTQQGILNEVKGTTGVFQREKVQSINGMAFDVPGKHIGDWMYKTPWIRKWAENMSNKQLSAMAAKTGTVARTATENDVRYQLEGIANTGLFELAYTSLCTAGLYFLGKFFAGRHKDNKENPAKTTAATTAALPAILPGASPQLACVPPVVTDDMPESKARKELQSSRPRKSNNHLDLVSQSRSDTVQLGV